jgi:hypothetical protein
VDGPIKREAYTKFIIGWLKEGGYVADKKDLTGIFEIGEDVSYNIQRLCNVMWEAAIESRRIDLSMVEKLPFFHLTMCIRGV